MKFSFKMMVQKLTISLSHGHFIPIELTLLIRSLSASVSGCMEFQCCQRKGRSAPKDRSLIVLRVVEMKTNVKGLEDTKYPKSCSFFVFSSPLGTMTLC